MDIKVDRIAIENKNGSMLRLMGAENFDILMSPYVLTNDGIILPSKVTENKFRDEQTVPWKKVFLILEAMRE